MKKKLIYPAILAGLLAGLGCAGHLTKLDSTLFDTTQVLMVTQRPMTNVVTVTNTVAVFQTNEVPITVIRTNELNQVTVSWQTNEVVNQTWQTNLTYATNVVAAGSTVMVDQLSAPSKGTQAGTAVVSGVAGAFGYGGIASTVLAGLLAWYQKSRNATLAAAAVGATSAQQVAQQASTTLVQNLETLMTVLQQTPQGQQLLPAVKNYLVQHQATTGTITTIAQLVKDNVDEPAAKDSAAEILKAVRGYTSGGNETR